MIKVTISSRYTTAQIALKPNRIPETSLWQVTEAQQTAAIPHVQRIGEALSISMPPSDLKTTNKNAQSEILKPLGFCFLFFYISLGKDLDQSALYVDLLYW